MDLYHFDKDGKVHVASINNGIQNEVSYICDPLFTQNFPVCSGWVNLKDFNGDGIEDLFTFNTDGGVSGIRVFKGFYNADGKLDFTQYFNPQNGEPFLVFASSPSPNAFVTNIYATEEDYPAFVDVDYDGDLDILNFGSDGTYVKWYKNVSTDPEELEFVLGDFCWGGFGEGSLSQEIFLNLEDSINCVVFFNDTNEPSAQPLHPGSTLLAFDEDGDQDASVSESSKKLSKSFLDHTNRRTGAHSLVHATQVGSSLTGRGCAGPATPSDRFSSLR